MKNNKERKEKNIMVEVTVEGWGISWGGEGWGRDGTVVRTLISHQCCPEIRFLDTDSADSVLAPLDVSLVAMVFPLLKNQDFQLPIRSSRGVPS